MGKFWSSMATAFQIATNGQASPRAALDDAKKNMEKWTPPARKSHKPKRLCDFHAKEPLPMRLWRKIGFKWDGNSVWALSQDLWAMQARGFPVQWILVALAVLAGLYLDFSIYLTGNVWAALALLILIGIGAYVYLSDAGYTYRYLFPGFLGFGLFVIFPIVYMVYLSFTKYSSKNLLYFDRSLALLRQESYTIGTATYKYKLYRQGAGQYIHKRRRN
jgi:hypothetical protein